MSKSDIILMTGLPHTRTMSVQFEHPATLMKINGVISLKSKLKSTLKSDEKKTTYNTPVSGVC